VLAGTGGFAGATILWLGVGLVCLMGTTLFADLSGRIPEGRRRLFPTSASRSGGPASFVYGWMYFGVANTLRQATVYAAISERLSAWISRAAPAPGLCGGDHPRRGDDVRVKSGAITQRISPPASW